MGIIAIGDIHGCMESLRLLERAIPLGQGETLVTVGDYVDRGPQSCQVVEWLLRYREQGGTLISLLGNHELMMMQAREGMLARNRWLSYGGLETLQSYPRLEESSGGKSSLDDVPDSHWKFFEECRPYYETESHVFVHANLHPEVSLEEQPEEWLFWKRFGDPVPHLSGKQMICGHTPQPSGQPKVLPHAICIDTQAYQDGWLTALEVETGHCWQANEAGEVRTGYLDLDS